MTRLLRFGGKTWKGRPRMLSELVDVAYDKKWLEDRLEMFGDSEVYYMFRGLYADDSQQEALRRAGLRFDVTIVPPFRLGCEYVKTLGHYHPVMEKSSELSYPEIYEVVGGEAHFLLQRVEEGVVKRVVLIEAKRNEKVVVPPNYGHVTINPSDEELRLANLVSNKFESIYEPIRKYGGAAYFELVGGKLIPNHRYGRVPEIEVMGAKELRLVRGLGPLASSLKDPSALSFLNSEDEAKELLEAFEALG